MPLRRRSTTKPRPKGNPYIVKRGDWWCVIQKGTRRTLSRHKTKGLAEASFRAMEASKRRREGA